MKMSDKREWKSLLLPNVNYVNLFVYFNRYTSFVMYRKQFDSILKIDDILLQTNGHRAMIVQLISCQLTAVLHRL